MTRRQVLSGVGMASLAARGAGNVPAGSREKLRVCVFSKHFQWTDVPHAAALAASIGFDGLDLTVRSGGHVEPEGVERTLPRAVDAVRKAGIEVTMITTGITAPDRVANAILESAGGLGIRHYRFGGLRYAAGAPVPEQLAGWAPQMKGLAALNEKCRIAGMYHMHSGPAQVGGPVWDLWTLFRELDPRWIGVNFDIGHATVEGGYGGWMTNFQLVQERTLGIAIKDFYWDRNDDKNTLVDPYDPAHSVKRAWVPHWCPPGQGMVNIASFLEKVRATRFSGPVQLHFEYPGLGGANNGDKKLSISEQELAHVMKRDLDFLRTAMHSAALS